MKGRKKAIDINKQSLGGDGIESLEDDETRHDSKNIPVILYHDDVQSLTDKTFNKSLEATPLSAVLFFVGFDSVSTILKPVFANVNELLSKLTMILLCQYSFRIDLF